MHALRWKGGKYDPSKTKVDEFDAAIEKAGYNVAG